MTESEIPRALETAQRLVAQSHGAGQTLVVPHDEREIRMWVTPRKRPGDLSAKVSAAGVPVRIALGSAAPGVEGFRESHREAERVRRVMLASGRDDIVVTHRQVASLALMSDDLPLLRRFVQRTLGKLAADDERVEPLRETLRVFLAHHCGYAATAEAMNLHRNSVRYRVDRALELCGRDLDDPATVLDLATALEASHWVGPSVLD